jgi:FKBP12-rapamycin complex-associated protein
MEIWLQVIPQLIARIDTNKQFVARLIHNLLIEFGRVHPQALVYRLILASKCSPNTTQQQQQQQIINNFTDPTNQTAAANRNVAASILQSLREHNNNMLVDQAKLVSEELIRVAILWHEMWHESLEEASKLYFGEKNIRGMLDTLDVLHILMDKMRPQRDSIFASIW